MSGTGEMNRAGKFAPFAEVLMLRLDFAGASPYYITPFVTDGDKLYVFEEPGDASDVLDERLIDQQTQVSSLATGELVVAASGARPSAAEDSWARHACSVRFHYDQALQDLAQLGTIVALG